MFKTSSVVYELEEVLSAIYSRYAKGSVESYQRTWKLWISYHQDWQSAKAIHANQFIELLKNKPIETSYRKGELRSKNTIKKHIMILYSLYDQLIDAFNLDTQNPFSALFRDYKRMQVKEVRPTKMLNYDDVQKLVYTPTKFGKSGIRDAAFFALLFGAALRRSEAVKLNIENVKHKDKLIYIELLNTKNKDDANQVLPKWAAIILTGFVAQRIAEGAAPEDPLFVGYSRWQMPDSKRVTASAMWYRLKTWCKRLKLAHIGTHSGRATAITKLLDDGKSHRDICRFSRHKSIQMVELYDKKRLELEDDLGLELVYSKKSKR